MLAQQQMVEAVEILCSLLGHNDYYKYIGSQSIILLQQMRIKALINESTLHKITKPNCYSIKNKVHQLQRATYSKSLKNIEPNQAITNEIESCLYALESCLSREEMPERDICQRVIKLLMQMKAHSESEGESDFRQDTGQSGLRSSSSKFHLKGRWQSVEDNRKTEGMVLIQRPLFEFKKVRGNKLKINKQNNEKCPMVMEFKLEKMTDRLDESQKLINELKTQNRRLSKRLKQMELENEELIFEKQKLQKQIVLNNSKLDAQIEKVVQLESQLNSRVNESSEIIQVLKQQNKLLGERLFQRQSQITAIWQLQKF